MENGDTRDCICCELTPPSAFPPFPEYLLTPSSPRLNRHGIPLLLIFHPICLYIQHRPAFPPVPMVSHYLSQHPTPSFLLSAAMTLSDPLICSFRSTQTILSPGTFSRSIRKYHTCPFTTSFISIQTQIVFLGEARYTFICSKLVDCIWYLQHGLPYIVEIKCGLGNSFAEHSVLCNGHLELMVAFHFIALSNSHSDLSVRSLYYCHSEPKHSSHILLGRPTTQGYEH